MNTYNHVLVTGGAGFIGSHLVEALLKRRYTVRVVDNLVTGRLSNLAHLEGEYEWIEGDLSDFDVCRRAVEGVNYVFHQAAQTRDFTYVANAVAANLSAMDYPQALEGAVYNVGTGRRISLLDLVAALNTILGTAIQAELQPARGGDVRDSQASLDRIRRKLNYQPIIDFEDGLRLSVKSLLPNSDDERDDKKQHP